MRRFSWAAFVLVACSSPSASTSHAPDAGPIHIVLAENDWDGARLDVAIVRILLTEHLGYVVDAVKIDGTAQYPEIAAGRIHASLEVWPSGHEPDFAAYLDTGKVERGGALGPIGKVSWYVPTYLLETYPQLATWKGFQDPAMVDLFRTPESGIKGRFLDGPEGWGAYDDQIIANLKLDFAVVHASSEESLLAELDREYGKRSPVLFYFWTPHAAHVKYDLTAIELPPYTDACYAKEHSGGIDCDYPTERLFKIFWPGLKTLAPRAYSLLSRFTYTTKDQIELLAKIDFDKVTVEQAARGWVDTHQTEWGGWIDGK